MICTKITTVTLDVLGGDFCVSPNKRLAKAVAVVVTKVTEKAENRPNKNNSINNSPPSS